MPRTPATHVVATRRPGRTRTSAVAAAAALLVLVGLVSGPAAGSSRSSVEQRQDDVQEEIQRSEQSLEHISEELSAATAQLASLETQLAAARDTVADATAAADEARKRDARLAADLDAARTALAATTAELTAREAEAEETRGEVTQVVRETYRGGQLNELAVLVEAQDPQEYADMMQLTRVARRAQDRTLARLEVQQAEIRGAKARQQAQEDELEDLKAEAEAAFAEAEAAERRAVEAEAQVEQLVAEQAAGVEAVEAAKVAEEQRLGELSAESDALADRLAAIAAEEERRAAEDAARQLADPGGSGGSASTSSGFALSSPVAGRMTSPFGYRVHPILGYRRLHSGSDYGAACGTPVYAAADGTVVSAGWAGGYGNHIVVSHGVVRGVSLATTYSHLSSFAVRSGSVSRGQLIGYVGTTGMSTGCHLHFETREAGTPVNPTKWL